MDALYDPTADDLAVKQAIMQAAALRKVNPAPEGQMVSGHYVKPSFLQQLQPLVGGMAADAIESRANDKQTSINAQNRQALSQWVNGQPQGTTTYGSSDAGPTMTKAAPTDAQNLGWQAAGMTNPLTKAIAARAMEDNIVNAPIRAEKAVDKKDLLTATLADKETQRKSDMDKLVMTLNQRHDDLLEKIASNERMGGDSNAMKQSLMQNSVLLQQLKGEQGMAVQGLKNDGTLATTQARAAAGSNKPILNATQQKEMAGFQDEINQHKGYLDAFKPDYTGFKVYTADKLRTATGQIADKSLVPAMEFWRNFRAGDNVVRHGLYGSALTPGEAAAWQSTTVGPNDSPEMIQNAIQMRQKIVQQKYDERVKLYGSGGQSALGGGAPPPPVNYQSSLPRSTGREPSKFGNQDGAGNPVVVPTGVQNSRNGEAASKVTAELNDATAALTQAQRNGAPKDAVAELQNTVAGLSREVKRMGGPAAPMAQPADISSSTPDINALLNKYK